MLGEGHDQKACEEIYDWQDNLPFILTHLVALDTPCLELRLNIVYLIRN